MRKSNLKNGSGRQKKTAVDIFLEDEGPYSRKLYGPPPPVSCSSDEKTSDDAWRKKRTKSHEILNEHQQPSPDSGLSATDHLGVGLSSQPSSVSQQYLQQSDHNGNTILPSSISPGDGADGNAFIKKGLLWQQRDKLFSRWKERFFILTKEYFHCFKKGSSRLTEMGGFIFKVKLSEIESVDLLDKRGYLTICITMIKDAKIYLRRPDGIREWHTCLQNNVYEWKKRRNFWAKRQVNESSANIEQWLLARQKAGGMPSSPYSQGTDTELASSGNRGTPDLDKEAPKFSARDVKAVPLQQQQPQPILIKDPRTKANNRGPTSFSPTAQNGLQQQQHSATIRNGGINRMSLVNELIMKEKLQSGGDDGETIDCGVEETSSGAGSSSHRVGSAAFEENVNDGRETRRGVREDSGNDSGHNSMMTHSSSDNQSDNSSNEENSSKKTGDKEAVSAASPAAAACSTPKSPVRMMVAPGLSSAGGVSSSKRSLASSAKDLLSLASFGKMASSSGGGNERFFQGAKSVDSDLVLMGEEMQEIQSQSSSVQGRLIVRERESRTSSRSGKINAANRRTYAFGQVITEV